MCHGTHCHLRFFKSAFAKTVQWSMFIIRVQRRPSSFAGLKRVMVKAQWVRVRVGHEFVWSIGGENKDFLGFLLIVATLPSSAV